MVSHGQAELITRNALEVLKKNSESCFRHYGDLWGLWSHIVTLHNQRPQLYHMTHTHTQPESFSVLLSELCSYVCVLWGNSLAFQAAAMMPIH